MKKFFSYLLAASLYPLVMPWLVLHFPAFGEWWINWYGEYILWIMELSGFGPPGL